MNTSSQCGATFPRAASHSRRVLGNICVHGKPIESASVVDRKASFFWPIEVGEADSVVAFGKLASASYARRLWI